MSEHFNTICGDVRKHRIIYRTFYIANFILWVLNRRIVAFVVEIGAFVAARVLDGATFTFVQNVNKELTKNEQTND